MMHTHGGPTAAPSPWRAVVTDAASSPARAEAIGALFDLMGVLLRTKRNQPAATAVLLRLAAEGPQRACDLAEGLGLDQSTVSRHVQALEADSLVDRVPLDDDRRAHRVALTPLGTQAAAARVADRVRVLETPLADWSDDDVARLADLLHRFADGLAAAERTTP